MDKEESAYLALEDTNSISRTHSIKTIRVWRTMLHSYSPSTGYMDILESTCRVMLVHGEVCGYIERYMDLDVQQIYHIW